MEKTNVVLPQVTETDYKAWLSFLWTCLTFLILILMVIRCCSTSDIITVLSPFITLDGIIIHAYFTTNKNNGNSNSK